MRFKLTNDILEIILFGSIMVTLGFVFFNNDEPIKVQSEPSIQDFNEYPLQAWQTLDKKGGECVKVRYRVEKNKTRLYMINANGKKVHTQPISLSPHRDGRDRVETYVWKLYRTEWTDKIPPGEYLIIVGTEHDKSASRNLTLEIDIM